MAVGKIISKATSFKCRSSKRRPQCHVSSRVLFRKKGTGQWLRKSALKSLNVNPMCYDRYTFIKGRYSFIMYVVDTATQHFENAF